MTLDPRTLDHAMAWFRSGNLGHGPVRQDDEAAFTALAQQVDRCFATYPDVLQLILDLTAFRPPVDYALPPGQAERYALHRQGQNSIAASLLRYIAHAHEGDHHAIAPVREPDLESPGWGSPGGLGGGDAAFWGGDTAVR